MVGAVNEGHTRGGMVEMLAERQAAEAGPEDDNMTFCVLHYVTVSYQCLSLSICG